MVNNRIRILFITCFVLFILNKSYVRRLLEKEELPDFLKTLSFSIPNFFEAVMGTLVVVAILLVLKSRRVKLLLGISENGLKWIGIVFSAIYVITQELKIHNLGGRNVYDVNDLIASVVGIIFVTSVIFYFGMERKEPSPTTIKKVDSIENANIN